MIVDDWHDDAPWPGDEDFPHFGGSNGTPPTEESKSELDRLRASVMHGADVEKIPAPDPLIADWLDLGSLAVLYGRPAGGKSFIAMDMALHVATNSWWYGQEVAAGPVLYVAAEGQRGLGIRQRAWKSHNRMYSDEILADMHWLPRAVRLIDPVSSSALFQLCEEIDPKLVVVDTLARSMSGGDENSGKDMSKVVDACDAIRHGTGACVLLVHHTGKDQSAGARGWSGLLGAVDTELELKSAEGVLELSTTKQKENAEQPPLRFVLVKSEESMAIAKYTGRNIPDGSELTSKHQVTLDALASIDMGEGASATEWAAVAEEQGIKRSTFFRHRKALVEAGLVGKVGTDGRPKFTIIPPDPVDEIEDF